MMKATVVMDGEKLLALQAEETIWNICGCSVAQSCPYSFMTQWTTACEAPLSLGFPSEEYSNALSFPSAKDLPNLGIEPRSPMLEADSLPSEPPGNPDVGSRTQLTGEGKSTWTGLCSVGEL